MVLGSVLEPAWIHSQAVQVCHKYRQVVMCFADGAISGYVFMVDGGAVSWSSKKQELVTLSTMEAEYVTQTHAAKEAIWLRRLLTELFGPMDGPTTLFSDSKSAIALAQDGHYHAHTKHIDIHYHFIRYIVEAGSIKLVY